MIKFISYFTITFILICTFLYTLDIVPESLRSHSRDSVATLIDQKKSENIPEEVVGEEPVKIVIESVGVDSIIYNPTTTKVEVLDDYLKKGAVRYPGSGLAGKGNMFIFAHSTGFKVVQNQAYKTFNGLKNLKKGDIIKIYSAGDLYQYRISSVVLVDQSQALVEFGDKKNMLTLSTCNTFGAKGERYVVQADLVI